ncbi:GNAT family N-acetyltransferase [Saccharomonospora sp. NPDC006951]
MRIRTARVDELDVLRDIERSAGLSFLRVGMPEIAEDEPLPVETLAGYQRRDSALVSVDDKDRPIAYVLTEPVDGCVHIEQISVHPDHGRRGVGRALLDHVAVQARADGIPALTLTTFAEVAWNAPYYRRCGFRELGDDELTPGLRALREREAAHGLDRWPRVCMRRDL